MMPTDIETPPSQRDRSLPMIVNLRGDEDYASDFHVDAEAAMELLGIKRSRLTQISGRELRVGRIRRDRYLRPVYRELDLRDYQEWTRATATHQSSSKAIEQAIDSLDDRFNDLFVVLHERLQHFQSQELAWFGQKFSRLRGDLSEVSRMLEASSSKLDRDLEAQRRQSFVLTSRQQRQIESGEKQLALAEQTDQRLIVFHQDLREAISAIGLVRREQQELSVALEQSITAQREAAAQRLQEVGEASDRIETMTLTISKNFSALENSLVELAHELEASPRVIPSLRKKARRNPRLGRPYF